MQILIESDEQRRKRRLIAQTGISMGGFSGIGGPPVDHGPQPDPDATWSVQMIVGPAFGGDRYGWHGTRSPKIGQLIADLNADGTVEIAYSDTESATVNAIFHDGSDARVTIDVQTAAETAALAGASTDTHYLRFDDDDAIALLDSYVSGSVIRIPDTASGLEAGSWTEGQLVIVSLYDADPDA